MSRVPRIRFKGFEEDWEQRKLGEVANRFDSTRVPISENLRVSGNTPYYGANGIQDYVDGYTHDGEYVLIAEDGANDLKNYPIRLVKGRIWVNNHAHVIQGIEKSMNNQFINFAMTQVDFESIVVGCGRAKLNAEQLMNICFKVPNKNEQANIGRLFVSLNNLITLHQRKLEKLKIIKKSMLENIFPQNGEKTPKIRFSGFTEDWEQRKLGEICQITMGQSPDGSTYSQIPLDYILVQGNADLKDGWVYPRIWTTQKTKMAEAGDLIMSVRAPAGTMGKTYYDVVIGRGVAGIKGSEFIYQALVKMDSNGYWKVLASGSTFESINSDVVNGAELMVTENIDEQNKIGDYLASIDYLITLHQSKLDKLQKIKKSMLESMFV